MSAVNVSRSFASGTDAKLQSARLIQEEGPAMLRLFLASFAALYLEIVLIRWIGTEVRVFAFVQNLALVASFLGFALGCFGSGNRGSVLHSLLAITGLTVIVNLPLPFWKQAVNGMSTFLTISPDAALWGDGTQFSQAQTVPLFLVAGGMLAVFLILIVIAMVPLGHWVGFYLDEARRPVRAYSVNLLGSLAGVWLLAVLGLFWLPPAYWFLVAFLLVLFVEARPSRRFAFFAIILLAVTLFSLRVPKSRQVGWSPYQKLQVTPYPHQEYQIDVNNTGYMSIANVTAERLARDPELARKYLDSSYDSPFRFAQHRNRVLIIGAGAGNDAAAALRNGAEWVDAVEIDPLIYSLGERLHPEHPYDSPKVHKIINDARNYLRTTHHQYDVIVFALLDSHTEFSGYSNMRIDNYVYTEESFREARRLLAPDGILVLKFEVRKPWTWMGQRFYAMLERIFGRAPVTYYCEGVGALFSATVFVESDSPTMWQRAAEPNLARFTGNRPPAFPLTSRGAPSPTSDDWPYVYHAGHFLPRAYFAVSVILIVMALWMVGPFFRPKESATWFFFFLGGGFMLLETQLISRLALYFGSTWTVNCIALTFILLVLLLANWYVERRRIVGLSRYFTCLVVSLLIDYVIPWERISGSSHTVGLLLGGAYCVPLFFAGVIFTECLRRSTRRSEVLGANILGAVAGGLAHNLSFLLGMKALLLVSAFFYAAGWALYAFAIRATQRKPSSMASRDGTPDAAENAI